MDVFYRLGLERFLRRDRVADIEPLQLQRRLDACRQRSGVNSTNDAAPMTARFALRRRLRLRAAGLQVASDNATMRTLRETTSPHEECREETPGTAHRRAPLRHSRARRVRPPSDQ